MSMHNGGLNYGPRPQREGDVATLRVSLGTYHRLGADRLYFVCLSMRARSVGTDMSDRG